MRFEEAFSEAYAAGEGHFKRLETEVNHIICYVLDQFPARTHSTTSRVKTLGSSLKKALSRASVQGDATQAEEALAALDDVVGARIICLFRDDLLTIVNALLPHLGNPRVDNKLEEFDTSSSGYQSIHIKAQLLDSSSGPRYDSLKGMPFEIQVRTVSMDAWANISHHLCYKNEEDVPPDQRRSFRALAGLFYVADTEFQALYNMRQETLSRLRDTASQDPKKLLSLPITADNLAAYLEESELYEGRMADVVFGEVRELGEDLRVFGYEIIEEVDKIVRAMEKKFLESEESLPPYREHSRQYGAVGRVRVSVALAEHRLF